MNHTYVIDPENDIFDVVVRLSVRTGDGQFTDVTHRCGNAKVRPAMVINKETVDCLTCGSQFDLYPEGENLEQQAS